MVLSPLPAASLVTESFSLDLSLEVVYLVKLESPSKNRRGVFVEREKKSRQAGISPDPKQAIAPAQHKSCCVANILQSSGAKSPGLLHDAHT